MQRGVAGRPLAASPSGDQAPEASRTHLGELGEGPVGEHGHVPQQLVAAVPVLGVESGWGWGTPGRQPVPQPQTRPPALPCRPGVGAGHSRLGGVHGRGGVADVLGALEHAEGQAGQEVPRGQQAGHGPQLEAGPLCLGGGGRVMRARWVAGAEGAAGLGLRPRGPCAGTAPFRKRETSSSCGIRSSRYPQKRSSISKASRCSRQAWVGYRPRSVE